MPLVLFQIDWKVTNPTKNQNAVKFLLLVLSSVTRLLVPSVPVSEMLIPMTAPSVDINLLECPIPALSSVLVSQKIRITSPLPVFLKHGQMDFSKASNSISHQLTLIFPENCQIFLGGLGGWVGYLRGSRGLSGRRARRTKSVPEGPPTRSRGPEGPLDFYFLNISIASRSDRCGLYQSFRFLVATFDSTDYFII